jgi:NAD(P)-dependent dehydrogenase (short-subunit alcohol dehydrogenase family)
MEKLLLQKVAVVTGGTRGIGRAITERLLREGASVVFCGRSEDAVRSAARELAKEAGEKVFGAVADVSDPQAVSRLFAQVDERYGALHVLINNAGIGIFRPVADLTLEDWRQTLDLNLSGVFYCSREALQRFNNRGGGYIINISSLAGKNAFSGGSAYNASKFGLSGFTEAMMLDTRYENVRVSEIMPGSVATEFGSGHSASQQWKIAASDVAEVVVDLLRMPERTLISRVEMRPSKPKK